MKKLKSEDMAKNYRNGLSLTQLARKYPLSIPAIRARLLKMGVTMRQHGIPNKLSKAQIDSLVKDRLAGMSVARISEEYDISEVTARKYLRERHIRVAIIQG